MAESYIPLRLWIKYTFLDKKKKSYLLPCCKKVGVSDSKDKMGSLVARREKLCKLRGSLPVVSW